MNSIIQVAGVKDYREAADLIKAGVDWLGFPLRLPVHEEELTEDEAANIIRALPHDHPAVLITYLDDAREIILLCRRLGVRHVQIHGNIASNQLLLIKQSAPDLFVIKSLIVRGDNLDELLAEVERCEGCVNAFITDTYDPRTGACGATGKTHDWAISRRIVEATSLPVILAGGLKAENVRQAILQVRPAGVDAHTGLEGPDSRKDIALVRRFVAEARAAFASIRR